MRKYFKKLGGSCFVALLGNFIPPQAALVLGSHVSLFQHSVLQLVLPELLEGRKSCSRSLILLLSPFLMPFGSVLICCDGGNV